MHDNKPIRARSDKLKRLMARASEAALSFGKRMKSRLLAAVSKKAGDGLSGADPSGDPLQRLQAIMERRKLLYAQIEAASKRSLVPDGLSLCLYENFRDESRERARLLCVLEHDLAGILGRLKALCPAPLEPDPTPSRPRKFRNFGDWLNGTSGLAK